MLPVLLLCLAGFVLTAVCHLLAIIGGLPQIPTPLAWVLLIQMFVGFVLAIWTHPKRQERGDGSSVGWAVILGPLSFPLRVAYGVLVAYSIVAVFGSWPSELMESDGSVPMLEALDLPFFFTAVVLHFSVFAVLISHSAVLARRHPLGSLATP